MNIEQAHAMAGAENPAKPITPSAEVRRLCVSLIAEELHEFCQAMNVELLMNSEGVDGVDTSRMPDNVDLVAAYDAIIDLLYVTIGAACAMGMKIQPGWDEVHSSNMTKFIDGYKREDGKWIKGPSYRPANLQRIIQQQLLK